jgi:hypothetical protein
MVLKEVIVAKSQRYSVLRKTTNQLSRARFLVDFRTKHIYIKLFGAVMLILFAAEN